MVKAQNIEKKTGVEDVKNRKQKNEKWLRSAAYILSNNKIVIVWSSWKRQIGERNINNLLSSSHLKGSVYYYKFCTSARSMNGNNDWAKAIHQYMYIYNTGRIRYPFPITKVHQTNRSLPENIKKEILQ